MNKEKLDSAIGARLKTLRKRKKMTLAEAARGIGVTKQTLISYEQSTGNPSFTTLQAICRVYSISPNFLFTGNDDNVSHMDSALKRKVYCLFSLIVDGGIEFNQYSRFLRIKDPAITQAIAYCSAAFMNSADYGKLEILDKILRYIESL